MDSTLLISVISPMVGFCLAIGVLVHSLSIKKEENELEKTVKVLRQKLLKGELGRENFLYMKNSLKAEESFNHELQRLDEMHTTQQMDELTYSRMKKALQLIYNDKLVKIYENHEILPQFA